MRSVAGSGDCTKPVAPVSTEAIGQPRCVERGDEQIRQQREEGAVLVGHEGPDGGAAGALPGQRLRRALVLVEGRKTEPSCGLM